jgi:hypothetical protein
MLSECSPAAGAAPIERGEPTMRLLLTVVAVLVIVPAVHAERWGPTWSEVTGIRYTRATMHREPAIVKSVDGADTLLRIVKIDSGKHTLRLQSPTRKGFTGTDQELTMDFAPCQRYYVNAQFKSGLGRDWEPVIDQVTTIVGCKG